MGEEILLETQWSVTAHFYNQCDTVCVVEKDVCKSIDSVTVSGGDSIARILGCVRRMHAADAGTLEREIGDPVSDDPIDGAPAEIANRRNDRSPRRGRAAGDGSQCRCHYRSHS